jgi:RNA polymerase subunit RPABC4/transcription elongation factor Spt4
MSIRHLTGGLPITRCSGCQGIVHKPADACPWCGVVMGSISFTRCGDCGSLVHNADDVCPRCGPLSRHGAIGSLLFATLVLLILAMLMFAHALRAWLLVVLIGAYCTAVLWYMVVAPFLTWRSRRLLKRRAGFPVVPADRAN